MVFILTMLKSTVLSGPRCPSCGDRKMVTDQNTGELFCGKCGFVVSDKISDTGAEWRSFANDETNRILMKGNLKGEESKLGPLIQQREILRDQK